MLYANRSRAESFGGDAELYHRVRPRYPAGLIDHLVGDGDPPRVLDVGCGTGIAAQALAQSGCSVLGVEVDARMAAVAREQGIEVEVARFEDWDARGRTFDLVTSGQAWHWVVPERGLPRAADVLAPGGRIAAFWNFAWLEEPAAGALRAVYERRAPHVLTDPAMTLGGDASQRARTADDLRRSPRFEDPVLLDWHWERRLPAQQWVDNAATQSIHRLLDDDVRVPLLAAIGAAIDELGGEIPVRYDTWLVEATRAEQ